MAAKRQLFLYIAVIAACLILGEFVSLFLNNCMLCFPVKVIFVIDGKTFLNAKIYVVFKNYSTIRCWFNCFKIIVAEFKVKLVSINLITDKTLQMHFQQNILSKSSVNCKSVFLLWKLKPISSTVYQSYKIFFYPYLQKLLQKRDHDQEIPQSYTADQPTAPWGEPKTVYSNNTYVNQ